MTETKAGRRSLLMERARASNDRFPFCFLLEKSVGRQLASETAGCGCQSTELASAAPRALKRRPAYDPQQISVYETVVWGFGVVRGPQ